MIERDWNASFESKAVSDEIDRIDSVAPDMEGASIKISTWTQFFRLCGLLMSQMWYFRGESEARRITSTLERRKKQYSAEGLIEGCEASNHADEVAALKRSMILDGEKKTIEFFQEFEEKDFKISKNDYVRWLCVMQHYGVPTRLVDFTRSIFVALYFAFEKEKGTDRAVWAINADVLRKGRMEILKHLRESGKVIGNAEITDIEVAQIMIQDRNDDIDGIIPIALPYNNERMYAQDGLFLFPLNHKPFEHNLSQTIGVQVNGKEGFPKKSIDELNMGTHAVLQIVLSNELYATSRNVLSLANINSMTIYPDIQGVVKETAKIL